MATTDKKKLNGSGLGVVWGRVKTLFNGLSATVETNRIKHLGRVELLSLSATFEKNSVIDCAGIIYLSSDQVTGLPTNIVTDDGAMVTDDDEVVVDGDNTQTKWVYVAGRMIDDTPIKDSDNVVRSGGIYKALGEKQDSIEDLDDIRQGAELGSTALQSFKESDPTVPNWAKAPSKPTYIASEVMSISLLSISTNTSSSCSITGSENAGKSETIIYVNSGSADVIVTVPTTYSTPDAQAIELTCPVGGYCEVSYLNIEGTIYARGL